MFINNINGILNENFNASIRKNLQEEIDAKRKKLENASSKNRRVRLPRYDLFIKEIRDTLPKANVQIDTKNPSQYSVQYNKKIYKIPRNKDGVFYQYRSLRNGLKALNKTTSSAKDDFFLIEPMMPTLYSREEREKLKQFEADIINGRNYNKRG